MYRKNTIFLETSSTAEEKLYDYRVEWEDIIGNYDNAWDCFCDLRNDYHCKGVRLIRIGSDIKECVDYSK